MLNCKALARKGDKSSAHNIAVMIIVKTCFGAQGKAYTLVYHACVYNVVMSRKQSVRAYLFKYRLFDLSLVSCHGA